MVDKSNIIALELFINWNVPLILTEGLFDAITIKRNVVPLLGKTIPNALMKKIVTSQVKKIYLALDSDALKVTLQYAEELINRGKKVYIVELQDKDANAMGFHKFTELIHTAVPLTFDNLFSKKLELI